jgi:hypothetical protein
MDREVDGNDGVNATGKYARDYRLAAAVPMPPARAPRGTMPSGCTALTCFDHDQTPSLTQARILDRRTRLGAASPDLHLCQHLQTGLI